MLALFLFGRHFQNEDFIMSKEIILFFVVFTVLGFFAFLFHLGNQSFDSSEKSCFQHFNELPWHLKISTTTLVLSEVSFRVTDTKDKFKWLSIAILLVFWISALRYIALTLHPKK